ncbi:outer membrane lipoprotein carrier protein LolA [Actibacterium atlanticum]|uniref:Outer membrane lipoprotein carrier protein LolA n=1 Tax=Actibacterium atlanticum TaxID=1461693 RepID=A0A058ZMD9_9RHOB|nr:outer membrane lipoprotein carrier protein LolA [Actibacterium atlanticum]KCV82400.1 outer membrane lipoprotein carrier protein LolA [Actibacterium atlanticum]
MKQIRTAVLALAASVLTAVPALADKIPLSQISSYFNGFKTAQADFTQINADGTISTGTLFIKRPGRVRFEYNPPENALVLASGGQLAIYDPKSNQPPEQYPLRRTPLNLILAKNVDLNRAKMVVGHTSDDTSTTVVAQDPEHPEYGAISLVFTDSPVQLRQWIITDDAGGATTVVLGDLEMGNDYGPSLFSIVRETERRVGRDD